MKRKPSDKLEEARWEGPAGSMNGFFGVKRGSANLRIMVSEGGGWDHVSVSLATRCPTWEKMCWVKDLFFEPHEAVMQLHPAKSEYVNYHEFCLHLWRPQSKDEIERVRGDWGDEWPYDDLPSPGSIPLPPKEFVGPSEASA